MSNIYDMSGCRVEQDLNEYLYEQEKADLHQDAVEEILEEMVYDKLLEPKSTYHKIARDRCDDSYYNLMLADDVDVNYSSVGQIAYMADVAQQFKSEMKKYLKEMLLHEAEDLANNKDDI